MGNTINTKRRNGYDIVPKILCLVAAFILWLYVTQVETIDYEETFNGVPVELINTSMLESEAGLHVYNGHGNTVNVTVSGRKSDINKYSSDNIHVYADVSEITESGRHTLPIVADAPSGLSVSGMSVSFVNVYVDATSSIEADVKPKITTAIIGEGCELGELSTEFSLVTVTGPKTVLREVSHAEVALELGTVDSTVSTIAPLQLIGRNGDSIDMRYVQLSRNEVKVTVPVNTTKEVPLSVDFKNGYYNDNNVEISFEPKTIRIKGDPLDLDDITEIKLGTIDETTVMSDVKQVYKLALPDGVTSTDNIETVSVSISHIGTTLRTFTVNNIKLEGTDKLKCDVLTEALAVKIRGTKADLDKIKSENITATANLSEYGESIKGTVTVNAFITISGGGKSYSVGDYLIQVKID